MRLKKGSVVYTIELPEPATGSALIEAAKRLIEAQGHQPMLEIHARVIDGKRSDTIELGRYCDHPAGDLRLEVPDGDGWKAVIVPEASYAKLRVVNWGYAGMKLAVGFGDEAVITSVERFRNELAAALGA